MNTNHIRSIRRRFMAFVLLVALSLASFSVTDVNAAALPSLEADATPENMLRILKAYNKDGSFLAGYALPRSGFVDFLTSYGYIEPGASAADSIDTVVHESFHEFAVPNIASNAGSVVENEEKIYIGSKKSVRVVFTDVFRTKEMAKTVPARCRTSHYGYKQGDRFSTYVKDVNNNMASDYDGVYGLLNEFGGYCWGMDANNSLFSYRDRFADTTETWGSFITEGESDMLAYIEFKYYILHYLYYARQHHPEVYKGIINNKNFRRAYRLTEKRFSELIDEYEELLDEAADKLADNGYNLAVDELPLRRQYNVMTKELNKSQYKAMQKAATKR